jgi:tRNA(fMet)-specific endonuclease VapC
MQAIFVDQFRSIPLDDRAAKIAGETRAHLERNGNPVGPYDVLIAAIAIANDLTLVTHNRREFERIPGLKIED